MKTTELIAHLQALVEKHGDHPVAMPHAIYGDADEIDSIPEYVENKNPGKFMEVKTPYIEIRP